MTTALVIGGGLAGLAAASALARAGVRVTVLESRTRLGGRAGSFADAQTGQLLDACQHVSMGCCTNLKQFAEVTGIAHHLTPQPVLYFVTPDRRVSRFAADELPAPLHLGRALWGAHYLTAAEKLRVAYGLARLRLTDPDADPPLLPWLVKHRQTPRTIERFWGIVLTSALNETVERVGRKYARKVFVDGFMAHRDGFTVEVPAVPLGQLYGDELRGFFTRHGVTLRENAAVTSIVPSADGDRVEAVALRDGTTVTADDYILAVPFDRVAALVPSVWAERPEFAAGGKLTPSPITSVHLWTDRPYTDLPHAVFVDCLGQWLFNRGETSPGEFYAQVVVSAARPLKGVGRDETARRVADELAALFPVGAKVLRTKVVTEHAATFSAVPGVDAFRPPQATSVRNLTLAGDWTRTGWPATMEGAVRSGYLAAEAVLKRPGAFVQPDLGARHADDTSRFPRDACQGKPS